MKNFILLLWFCIGNRLPADAQNPNALNNYQCVFLPQLYYDKGKTDIYGIRKAVIDKLNSCGVQLFLDEKEISGEAMKNPCSMLQCIVNNTSSAKGSDFSDIKILFLDCRNDTVLNFTVAANLRTNFNDTRTSFLSATQRVLNVFNEYHYQYSKPDSSSSLIRVPSIDSDSIQWNTGRKLSWDDFKGNSDERDPADALTYTTHQSSFSAFGIGNRFHVESEVVCCFVKSKSWVKAGMKTDYLLNHEQRHFDLAEVGAREFRKRLKVAHFTSENFQKEVRRITTEIDEKYKKLQEQYDKETDHSRIEAKQTEWNLKIGSLLKELEEYK